MAKTLEAEDLLMVNSDDRRVITLASRHVERAGIVPPPRHPTKDEVAFSNQELPNERVVTDRHRQGLEVSAARVGRELNLAHDGLGPGIRKAQFLKLGRIAKGNLAVEG